MARDPGRERGLRRQTPGRTVFAQPTLVLDLEQYRTVVAHCWDGFPEEACGLFLGPLAKDSTATGIVSHVYPCRNAEGSARTYKIADVDYLRADNDARAQGLDIVGGWHSHTHTDPYPSATDVKKAPPLGPNFIFVIVSLRLAEPSLRAYQIKGEEIVELAVEVPGLA